MMVGFGFMEIVMLAMLAGGSLSTDLVALIQPQHYFQTKNIEISPARAVELANTEPKDAKSQILQLTALRYLLDESEALKKSPRYDGHRKAIEEIAIGKTAQDSLGFAKEYAQRVLDKLDGKRAEIPKLPPIRDEALAWFPANATLALAVDLRQSRNPNVTQDPIRDILKLIPDKAKREMYEQFEQVGNVRVERFAFAMIENPKERGKNKMFIRVTGKLNREWAIDTAKRLGKGLTVKEIGDKEEKITIAQDGNRAPIMALFGNTELLVVGYDNNNEKHDDVLTEALAARSKKQPNVTTGELKGQLAKVPDKAVALFVAKLSDHTKKNLGPELNPAPDRITAFIERMQQGLDVQVDAGMTNRDDADKLVTKIAGLRKEAINGLQQAMKQPLPPGTPPIPFQALINLVDSIQVQNEADRVQVRAYVPDGLIQQLGSMGMIFGHRAGGGFDPPPPPPPPKDK